MGCLCVVSCVSGVWRGFKDEMQSVSVVWYYLLFLIFVASCQLMSHTVTLRVMQISSFSNIDI